MKGRSHCDCHARGLLKRICIVHIIIIILRYYTLATLAYYSSAALITDSLSRYVTYCSKEDAATCHAWTCQQQELHYKKASWSVTLSIESFFEWQLVGEAPSEDRQVWCVLLPPRLLKSVAYNKLSSHLEAIMQVL